MNNRMEELSAKMSNKQKAFCDFYIESLNAAESARKAGYSEKTARTIGCENLAKPNIKEYIELRLKELESKRVADANEVLEYLSRTMRGEEKDQFGLEAPLAERTKAAELLGKRYKLFTERKEVDVSTAPVTIVNDIPKPE